MKRTLLAMLLLTAALPAQPPQPLEKTIARLVPVKHLRDRELEQAIQMFRVFNVQIMKSDMGVISVGGTESNVAAFEEAFKRLDVPPPPATPDRNVEVILYVVAATNQGADAIPPGLESVIKQMRGVFQYAHYRALDTQIMRVRVNDLNVPGSQRSQGASMGRVPHPTREQDTFACNTNLQVQANNDPNSRIFRFNNFEFFCYYPASSTVRQVFIRTDLDLREGQKAVVGKSSLGDDSAMFLVLTARQLE